MLPDDQTFAAVDWNQGFTTIKAPRDSTFDLDSATAEAYRVKGLPTTYLIDPQGRIRYQAIGGREFDHPEVEALIRSLMQ